MSLDISFLPIAAFEDLRPTFISSAMSRLGRAVALAGAVAGAVTVSIPLERKVSGRNGTNFVERWFSGRTTVSVYIYEYIA